MAMKSYVCFGIYFYKSMKFYVETRSVTTYIKVRGFSTSENDELDSVLLLKDRTCIRTVGSELSE